MQEAGEIELVGSLHARHDEGTGAVGSLGVHRQAEADVRVSYDPGRPGAVDVGNEGRIERRHRLQSSHDRPSDDVGEADLAACRPPELVVDDLPVDLEQLGRHRMHARRRRHGQGGDHVLDDPCGGTADRSRLVIVLRGCRHTPPREDSGGTRRRGGWTAGGGRCRRRREFLGGGGNGCSRNRPRRSPRRRAIIGEELLPAVAHRAPVGKVGLVHLFHEPRVCPIGAGGSVSHRVVRHASDAIEAAARVTACRGCRRRSHVAALAWNR